jgi:hypothetical protein
LYDESRTLEGNGLITHIARVDTNIGVNDQWIRVEHHAAQCFEHAYEPGDYKVAVEMIVPADEGSSTMIAASTRREDGDETANDTSLMSLSSAI